MGEAEILKVLLASGPAGAIAVWFMWWVPRQQTRWEAKMDRFSDRLGDLTSAITRLVEQQGNGRRLREELAAPPRE